MFALSYGLSKCLQGIIPHLLSQGARQGGQHCIKISTQISTGIKSRSKRFLQLGESVERFYFIRMDELSA